MARGYFRVSINTCVFCGKTHGYNAVEVRRARRNLFLCKDCLIRNGYDWENSAKIILKKDGSYKVENKKLKEVEK